MMEELKGLIEQNRFIILSKIVLFNNIYAEYLLTFKKFKKVINYSENHLFWSKKNELLESKHVGIYGIKNKFLEQFIEDDQLKPLLISYLSIKSIMQNDKKVFEKWQVSFDNLAEELSSSIGSQKTIPEDKLKRFYSLIGKIKDYEKKLSGKK